MNSESDYVSRLPFVTAAFMIALVLPSETSFYIGNFRLSFFRIILLSAFLPCLREVFISKKTHTTLTDWLILGYSAWMVIAIGINNGFSKGIESGGILAVESLGAYLLARVYIDNQKKYNRFLKILFIIIIIISFFTLLESISGTNLLKPGFVSRIEKRLIFYRVFGPFDHPILYGIFCGSAVSLRWFYKPIRKETISKKNIDTGWIVVATFLSVSGGALSSVIIQAILITWKRIARGMRNKWRFFIFLLVIFYIFTDLLSNRSPMRVILHRLTFSAETAYNRIAIWEWGTKYNVAENPWFGIGMNDWVRPDWMHSTSMDNFWLVNMVRYGLPAFGMLSIGIIYLMTNTAKKNKENSEIERLCTGWLFSMVGFIVAGCTVHFWNNLYVWFFFLMGAGGWMLQDNEGV